MSNEIERIGWIDSIRALCVIWIIAFWHLDDYINLDFNTPLGDFLTIGCLASFTFISGYCLGGKKIENKEDWLVFFKRRFIRLYPLYVIACVLIYIMHLSLNINYIKSTEQFVRSLLGMSCIVPPAPSTIWFVNCILVYYAVTPFLLCWKNTKKKILVAMLLYLSVWALVFWGGADERLGFYFLFYLFGVLFAQKKLIDNKNNLYSLLVAIVVFMVVGSVSVYWQMDNTFLRMLLAGVLVIILMEIGKVFDKSKRIRRGLYYISYSSMCAYLFHRIILGLIFYYYPDVPVWGVYCILVPILFVLCYYIQRTYDRMIRYRR